MVHLMTHYSLEILKFYRTNKLGNNSVTSFMSTKQMYPSLNKCVINEKKMLSKRRVSCRGLRNVKEISFKLRDRLE